MFYKVRIGLLALCIQCFCSASFLCSAESLLGGFGFSSDEEDLRTPLSRAAEEGDVELIAFLLQRNADPNEYDGDGRLPIVQAVLNKHPKIVKMLLDFDADPYKRDDDGRTALTAAAVSGDWSSILEVLIGEPDKCDSKKLFEIAVVQGNKALFNFLLKRFRSHEEQCEGKSSPLWLSAVMGRNPHLRGLALKLCKESDCCAHLEMLCGSPSNCTPLHWASYGGYDDIVRALLKDGVPPNIQSGAGQTPLAYVLKGIEPRPEIVEELLMWGADPNGLNSEGNKALFNFLLKQFQSHDDLGPNAKTPVPLHSSCLGQPHALTRP